jgi:hypothetical protein
MLLLSMEGWFNGITAIFVLILGCLLGSFFVYKARKVNAKLLFFIGLSTICGGLVYLNATWQFFTIIITGDNLDIPFFFHFLTSWMWIYLSGLFAFYIATELLIPKRKWYFITLITTLITLIYITLLVDPSGNLNIVYPSSPGEDLIDGYTVPGIGSMLSNIVILLFIAFDIIGIFINSLRSTGVLRKKFLILTVGYVINLVCISLEGVLSPGLASVFIRIGIISAFWIIYFAIKEEPETPQEPIKKEVKIEGGLFRLTKRPDHITEDEVMFHKEKKICLVCKGNVGRYMFMCPECDALYCQNCAHALENLENACWVCNGPIDPQKPVKPYKKDGQEIKPTIKDDTTSVKL